MCCLPQGEILEDAVMETIRSSTYVYYYIHGLFLDVKVDEGRMIRRGYMLRTLEKKHLSELSVIMDFVWHFQGKVRSLGNVLVIRVNCGKCAGSVIPPRRENGFTQFDSRTRNFWAGKLRENASPVPVLNRKLTEKYLGQNLFLNRLKIAELAEVFALSKF